jgi:hypothetical protein
VTAFRLALLTTLLLLAALMGLGLGLQLGWRRLADRKAHHVLYFLITLGTVVTGMLALLTGQAWWPFLLLLALLLAMSRTRPGRPAHWRLALVIAVLYTGAAWWLW